MNSLHNATDSFYASVLTVASENKNGILPLMVVFGVIVTLGLIYSLQIILGKKCWRILRKWVQSYHRKVKEEDRIEYCLNMDDFSTCDPLRPSLSSNVDLQLRNLTKEVQSLKEAIRILTDSLNNRIQGRFGKEQEFEDGIGFLSGATLHRNIGWSGFHCASEQ